MSMEFFDLTGRQEPRRQFGMLDLPPAVELVCLDKSLTRQSELAASDVNRIVAQYDKTGMLPQVTVQGLFVDVSEAGDYRTALDRVREADRVFNRLPAPARLAFDNDPAVFLDAFQSDEGMAQLRKLGLVEPLPVAAADRVPEAPPVDPAAS